MVPIEYWQWVKSLCDIHLSKKAINHLQNERKLGVYKLQNSLENFEAAKRKLVNEFETKSREATLKENDEPTPR